MSAEEMKRGIRTVYADGAYTGAGQVARLVEFDRMIAEVERAAAARAWDALAEAAYPLYEAAEAVLLHGADRETLLEPLGRLGALSNPYRAAEIRGGRRSRNRGRRQGMKYRIHFTLADGSEDSIIVSGGSIEAIRERAEAEVTKRGGRDPWSEEVA